LIAALGDEDDDEEDEEDEDIEKDIMDQIQHVLARNVFRPSPLDLVQHDDPIDPLGLLFRRESIGSNAAADDDAKSDAKSEAESEAKSDAKSEANSDEDRGKQEKGEAEEEEGDRVNQSPASSSSSLAQLSPFISHRSDAPIRMDIQSLPITSNQHDWRIQEEFTMYGWRNA
jgi:hypothetical protein